MKWGYTYEDKVAGTCTGPGATDAFTIALAAGAAEFMDSCADEGRQESTVNEGD